MYYLDTQRTITRRDSSLISGIANEGTGKDPFTANTFAYTDTMKATRKKSEFYPYMKDNITLVENLRPWGSIRNEIITSFFENMLEHIAVKWQVINKPQDSQSESVKPINADFIATANKKKKKEPVFAAAPPGKQSQKFGSVRSRSKIEVSGPVLDIISRPKQASIPIEREDPLYISWWASPDERAIIRFKNGNIYEGSISMKRMNGEGRFQWSNGTIFMGKFEDNRMISGIIKWKNDTWYEGNFCNNIRHGRGVYGDSRTGQYFAGSWYNGTKHGSGRIQFSNHNTYDGDWECNIRHGYGIREYCKWSGYKGDWIHDKRHGQGMMIWPDHDFYDGGWQNGVMDGFGLYIWGANRNNTMASPSLNKYTGNWVKGYRQGHGLLNLGLGLGSLYEGNFEENKKHGYGTFITNNGYMIHDQFLYCYDILGPWPDSTSNLQPDEVNFSICDSTVGLFYHIKTAIQNVDNRAETRNRIVESFIRHNRSKTKKISKDRISVGKCLKQAEFDWADFLAFEEKALYRCIKSYEANLLIIYNAYATMCCTRSVYFTPILIRLYLWQFCDDINMVRNGITLVEFDNIFHKNPTWLSKKPHDPFEKIYFWQFVHCLVLIAVELYCKKCMPGPKPETLVADAFRKFYSRDIVPNVRQYNGRLKHGFGTIVPLEGLYGLYKAIGEPHTVRDFIRNVNRLSSSDDVLNEDEMCDLPDKNIAFGNNIYVFGDKMSFVVDDKPPKPYDNVDKPADLLLYNFKNVPISILIYKVFPSICPNVCRNGFIMNLDIKLSFLEFYQAIIDCCEESIRIRDEEMKRIKILEKNASKNLIGTIKTSKTSRGSLSKSSKSRSGPLHH